MNWHPLHQRSFIEENAKLIFDNLKRQKLVKVYEPEPYIAESEKQMPDYCEYHSRAMHPTKDCPDLHDWIETNIREGVIDQDGNPLASSHLGEASQQTHDPSSEFQALYPEICEYYDHQLGYGQSKRKAKMEKRKAAILRYRNQIPEEAAAEPISQQAEEFVDDYYRLPSGVVEEAINSTFQAQASEGEWVTVGPRRLVSSRRSSKSMAKGGSSKRGIPKPSLEQEVINSLEALQIKNREKNRRKNEKRRMKRQVEHAAAAEVPQELSPVQRLQQLIDELEEYISPRPSDKPTLDQYIPWEEIERKTRLRDWLLQVHQEALQGKESPLSSDLGLFNEGEEITMEQLDSMFSSFTCNMVFVPPPKELQISTSDTVIQAEDKPTTLTYQRRPVNNPCRHLGRSRGRRQKAASTTVKKPDITTPNKVILFRGEESRPLPEIQIRADSYVFDPSDEEEGVPNIASHAKAKDQSPYASSNESDNAPPIPNEKLLAPLSQKKFVRPKEPSGSLTRGSSPLDQTRAEADDKILQQLKSLPINITVWEAIAWSKDLRETLVKILQEPETYEAHMANFQAQAYEALAANVTFTDEDVLLSSPYHNRPLYVKGKINGNELNRILIDPGVSINLMPYKTFESLHRMPYMQQGKQTGCSDEDSETGELFVIDKGLAGVHTKNFRSKSTRLERRSINYEADHVSQAINRSIPLPPNCTQIHSPKQDQSVRRLKRSSSLIKGKKKRRMPGRRQSRFSFIKGSQHLKHMQKMILVGKIDPTIILSQYKKWLIC
ncbi:hypothetical protein Taro_045248 [Colocasia esculenta]|uniref:Uncharacterized protein n=1 Tax=Colocasia esculenta TaxID=4460 RepID=A0A843WLH8_COLES|nr:hypothetical protein [Colocasia esculenta]